MYSDTVNACKEMKGRNVLNKVQVIRTKNTEFSRTDALLNISDVTSRKHHLHIILPGI